LALDKGLTHVAFTPWLLMISNAFSISGWLQLSHKLDAALELSRFFSCPICVFNLITYFLEIICVQKS
jgi:hypothetical protein